ncbi:hypothetical protein SUSAZ_10585 [Sulfolobus acidocaldarius SUSAZ]|nr:hypothetical protein SUSAZ_10585 [Sulfolobus acidocaldarius SUSAZ]
MIKLNRDQKLTYKFLVLPIALLILSFNPYTESLEFSVPAVYMASHYAVYFSGLYIGYKYFKGGYISLILGLIPAILWHTPYFFSLGAGILDYRILLEITLLLGGILLGSSINSMRLQIKITLLALWMLGDSILAILFITSTTLYSNLAYSFSPYPPASLPLAGILMFVIMNVFLIYVISKFMKSIIG